mmetsp:Transcript_33624/g.76032  ORF Transcript_33624/g.76032 Transcript_33624/m.76032 type:complete len:235 (-) Transcript_33624:799-1503(-)
MVALATAPKSSKRRARSASEASRGSDRTNRVRPSEMSFDTRGLSSLAFSGAAFANLSFSRFSSFSSSSLSSSSSSSSPSSSSSSSFLEPSSSSSSSVSASLLSPSLASSVSPAPGIGGRSVEASKSFFAEASVRTVSRPHTWSVPALTALFASSLSMNWTKPKPRLCSLVPLGSKCLAIVTVGMCTSANGPSAAAAKPRSSSLALKFKFRTMTRVAFFAPGRRTVRSAFATCTS